MNRIGILLVALFLLLKVSDGITQSVTKSTMLSKKEQSLATISMLTAIGILPPLTKALNAGLDAGLTVNEIKEELVQLYAYCGFPRSLNGLYTFQAVLEQRVKRGVKDPDGAAPTTVPNTADRYEQGKQTLERLMGKPDEGATTGMGQFAPAIDTFLKEHLFADIFGRGVLSDAQRELVTIAALSSLIGLDEPLRTHLSIGLHVGLTSAQLRQVMDLVEQFIGKKQAETARKLLVEAEAK